MTPRELIEAFGVLAEAPDGVKRLRELVLQLAVRGKLVPQVEGEEPAGRLLERIRKAKLQLVMDGKARKVGQRKPIADEAIPYALPVGWSWSDLESTFTPLSTSGNKILTRSMHETGQFPVVDQGQSHIAGYSDDAEKVIYPDRACIVFGDHTRAIKLVDFPFVAGADGVKILQPVLIEPAFMYYALHALNLPSRGYGRHYSLLLERPFPVPPLAEQHRIVAKVDELMAFLDKLEAAKTDRDATRKALRDAALAALREADSPDDVELAWGRIAEQMDELFAEPEDVAPLRQAVLQLAVRGRLVRQVEGDEPAGRLLEGSQLAEHPFGIPGHWDWVRCEVLCEHITKGTTPSKEFLRSAGDVPYIKVYNLTFDGTLNHGIDPTFVDQQTHRGPLARSKVFPGDVLMNIVGPPLGKVSIVPARYPEWNINQAIAIFRTRGAVSSRYLSMVLRLAPMLLAASGNATRGTAGQDNISLAQCRDLPVPLPPLGEQHLIVAKFDELMALLDKLESRLRESKRLQAAFAAAAVHHLEPENAQ